MRTVTKLRFKEEPTGLRGVVNSGMLLANNGWGIQLDEATGIVYITTAKWERALHVSDCAWVEFEPRPVAPPAKEPAPKK
jgi:hypothetical protein